MSDMPLRWRRLEVRWGLYVSPTHLSLRHGGSEVISADDRRQEIARITDQKVEQSLRQPDECAGKWLDEDPSLSVIQRVGSGTSAAR